MPARFDAATRTWHLVPDPRSPSPAAILVVFNSDPAATAPSVRLRPAGRDAPLSPTGPANLYGAALDLSGIAPGRYAVDVVEQLAGGETVVASKEIVISEPEYVVWTLDFEGDNASDQAMANTAAIADELKIPMTVMWNPRVWTTTQVAAARADAMLSWTKGRLAKGDELSLHLHMWTDFVRSAGVVARTVPSWAGRGDGYDVPMAAYAEPEQRALIDHALRLMAERGLARPTTFRAGGQFANDATLRVLSAAGFVADCSAVPAGSFGRLSYPWTLAADAQPYRPSAGDANRPGDLPLLEAPTIGGNTFGFDVRTVQPVIRANLSNLAPAGSFATAPPRYGRHHRAHRCDRARGDRRALRRVLASSLRPGQRPASLRDARSARAVLALGPALRMRGHRRGTGYGRSRRLTRDRLPGRARDRQHRDVSVATAVLHDLVHLRQNERCANERASLFGMRLVRVLKELVQLGADELLPLDERGRDGVDRVLLLLDEALGLVIELPEHVVDESQHRRRVTGHRGGRDRACPMPIRATWGSAPWSLHEVGARSFELRPG